MFTRVSTSQSKLDASLNNAIQQATNLTSRLSGNYPTSSELMTKQLDEMKVIAYPDKYKVGPDGQIYEITQ